MWQALPSAPHPHLRSGRTQSRGPCFVRAPSLPLPAARMGCREGGAHIRAWTGRGAQTGEDGRGWEDGCSVADATPSFMGVPRKRSARGCPSLHPFALPHAPQWGCAQPEGNTRGAPLPFGAPPPLRVSTTLRGIPHARPLCAPPFGCHARAVPHAGWRVQGGIRKVGCTGVVHAG